MVRDMAAKAGFHYIDIACRRMKLNNNIAALAKENFKTMHLLEVVKNWAKKEPVTYQKYLDSSLDKSKTWGVISKAKSALYLACKELGENFSLNEIEVYGSIPITAPIKLHADFVIGDKIVNDIVAEYSSYFKKLEGLDKSNLMDNQVSDEEFLKLEKISIGDLSQELDLNADVKEKSQLLIEKIYFNFLELLSLF